MKTNSILKIIMKKNLFLFLVILFLFSPIYTIHAGKIYTIHNASNINQSYPAVDSYNDNNIVAWMNLDDDNYIKSITIFNTATHKIENQIEFTTKMKFDSNPYGSRHKLKISDNWLAFSCRMDGNMNYSIVVFDIGKEKPEIVYQVNNFNTNEFDLYGRRLVFKQDEDYYGHNISINLIDLQNSNKLKKIIECEHCDYEDVRLYGENIIMTAFNWNKNEILIYDIEKKELQTEASIGDKQYLYPHRARVNNDKILYVDEFEGGKIYLYDKQSKTNKEIYNFPKTKQLVGVDLRSRFAVFAIGDFWYPRKNGKKYWNLYLYDIQEDKIYNYEEKDFIQFQPALSRDYIIWTSAEEGKTRIKYTSYADFINLLIIDNVMSVDSSNEMVEKLKGKIMLLVEKEGQAFYLNPKFNNGNYEMYYLGRPRDAFEIMRQQGVGISNNDLEKIPVADNYCPSYTPNCGKTNLHNLDFANSQKGKIFLQVENDGEAWYVNPNNGKRYFLGRPADAFQVMRNLGIGISDSDFDKLKIK